MFSTSSFHDPAKQPLSPRTSRRRRRRFSRLFAGAIAIIICYGLFACTFLFSLKSPFRASLSAPNVPRWPNAGHRKQRVNPSPSPPRIFCYERDATRVRKSGDERKTGARFSLRCPVPRLSRTMDMYPSKQYIRFFRDSRPSLDESVCVPAEK